MKLLIISDTPFYSAATEAYEPTLREIESVSGFFEEVLWLGYGRKEMNPGNARQPHKSGIHLKSLPVVRGGSCVWMKLRIFPWLPILFYMIGRQVVRYDVIHTRGPSIPALVSVLLSFVFRRKIWWHKYAGNWMQPHAPIMYTVQKKLLVLAKHTRVTINGNWPRQSTHIFSFENPCFTESEWKHSMISAKEKSFSGRLVLCYAGLIAEAKGVIQMMKGFALSERLPERVQKIIIAGNGPSLEEVKTLAEQVKVHVEFTGYLNREQLNVIYKQSHVLVLSSKTEGFPKVVAEAASFGCIPIVTDVSSIGQYVRDGVNGYLLGDMEPPTIVDALERLMSNHALSEMSSNAVAMSKSFTFDRFASRIGEQVLGVS